MSCYNECLRQGVVVWGAYFRNRVETNQILGLADNAGARHGGAKFHLLDGTRALIWWPKDEDDNYQWINTKELLGSRRDSQGYSEVLTISERNRDMVQNLARLNEEKTLSPPRNRYVFWHERTNGVQFYKFLGVFRFNAEQSDAKGCCVYTRIAYETPVRVASRR